MPRRNSRHLTDPGIEKIAKAPKGKRIERFDSGADGLALRITDRGKKTWCISYHFPDDSGGIKHHRYTIGPWPTIGIAQAREEARKVKEQAKAGIDPKAARAAAQAKIQIEGRKTFKVMAENYIKRECSRLKRGHEYEAVIRRELLPAWGAILAADLRPVHLNKLTDAVEDAGKPTAAYRIHEIAKRIFSWAVERGEIETSPFAAMKRPGSKVSRDRALKDHEVKALWSVWTKQHYPFGPLQQLLILLGQRRSEVAQMRWPEVDLDKREWTIPASRSKSKREHIVPLPDTAVEILEGLPRFTDGDYVFTTTGGRRPVSGFSKAKVRTDQMLLAQGPGIENWRVHDLRRTCRTGLARLGVPEIVSERILNHLPQGLGKIYNVHEYMDEKRNALEKWAGHIRDLIEPPPENVVSLATAGDVQ